MKSICSESDNVVLFEKFSIESGDLFRCLYFKNNAYFKKKEETFGTQKIKQTRFVLSIRFHDNSFCRNRLSNTNIDR